MSYRDIEKWKNIPGNPVLLTFMSFSGYLESDRNYLHERFWAFIKRVVIGVTKSTYVEDFFYKGTWVDREGVKFYPESFTFQLSVNVKPFANTKKA